MIDFIKLILILITIAAVGYMIYDLSKLSKEEKITEPRQQIDEIEEEPVFENGLNERRTEIKPQKRRLRFKPKISVMRYIVSMSITLLILYFYTAFSLWKWDFTILTMNYGAYPSLRRELGLIYILFLTLSICITYIYNRIKPPTKK